MSSRVIALGRGLVVRSSVRLSHTSAGRGVFVVSARQFSEDVKFRFYEESSGQLVEVIGQEGKTVLDVALTHNVDIEGACGGELACSTCHVIVPEDIYSKLPPKKEEEEDMLDLALGVTDT